MSLTDTLEPLPTLITSRPSPSLSNASVHARATSCTETKSRRCLPSSKTIGALPLSSRAANIANTPVYGFESAWWGP